MDYVLIKYFIFLFSRSGDQSLTLSEKEAAIATVAARTGIKICWKLRNVIISIIIIMPEFVYALVTIASFYLEQEKIWQFCFSLKDK